MTQLETGRAASSGRDSPCWLRLSRWISRLTESSMSDSSIAAPMRSTQRLST